MEQITDRKAQAAVAHMYRESREARDALRAEAEALKAQRATVEAQRRLVAREAEQAMSYVQQPNVRAWMEEVAAEPAPEEDTPEYSAWVGRQAALETVRGFFGELTKANATVSAQRQKDDAEMARQETVAAYKTYVQEHLDDFRNPEVLERVKVLMGKQIPIEEAHRISMAERLASQVKDSKELKAQAQAAARARVRPGGRSDPATATPPPNLSVVERDAWYQQHPEAARARLDRYRKGVA